jgi:hypothetical protein
LREAKRKECRDEKSAQRSRHKAVFDKEQHLNPPVREHRVKLLLPGHPDLGCASGKDGGLPEAFTCEHFKPFHWRPGSQAASPENFADIGINLPFTSFDLQHKFPDPVQAA